MLGRIKVDFDVSQLLKQKPREIYLGDNMYDVFEQLILNKAVIICGEEMMYAEEVCFDYKNSQIYIPYISCKYKELGEKDIKKYPNKLYRKYGGCRIAYLNTRSHFMLYKKGELLVDKLEVIVCINNEYYKRFIRLDNLRMHSKKCSREAQDLFDRYLAYSYGIYNESDYGMFYEFKKSKLSSTEKRLIKELNLEWYGEYIESDYTDVRRYKIEHLVEALGEDRLKIGLDYNLRRFQFEAELMTRLEEKLYWNNWTKGDIHKLVSGEHYFCKYKENGISLVFKREWI